MKKRAKKISWIEGAFWIVASLSLSAGISYRIMQSWPQKTSPEPLLRIVQTGMEREPLQTLYLAELIGVSADVPTYQLDLKKAEERLLASPLIKQAKLSLIDHNTLYVNYAVRHPVAYLYDFENMAFDEQGVCFPLYPFFRAKKLPQVYSGIKELSWGNPLPPPIQTLIFRLLHFFSTLPLSLVRIDISHAFYLSLGRREIVVMIKEKEEIKWLRLTPKNYQKEIEHYLQLRPLLNLHEQIVDLRIPSLAFIEKSS